MQTSSRTTSWGGKTFYSGSLCQIMVNLTHKISVLNFFTNQIILFEKKNQLEGNIE